jgi:hypothetical protein
MQDVGRKRMRRALGRSCAARRTRRCAAGIRGVSRPAVDAGLDSAEAATPPQSCRSAGRRGPAHGSAQTTPNDETFGVPDAQAAHALDAALRSSLWEPEVAAVLLD